MASPLRPGEYVATLDGLKIGYRIAGRGPVLMVQPPGWGPGAALYEASFAPLEESFTLVYHDPRGSGGSEHPSDADTLNVGQYADDLEALRAHLGIERFALIGHSHGGLVALWYAIHHPDRVTHLVPVSAQLIGPLEPVDEPEDVLPTLLEDRAFAEAFRVLQHEIGDAMMASPDDAAFTGVLARMAPLYFRDQRHTYLLTDFLASHRLPARTVRETSMRDGAFAVTERAREVRAPTLMLNGRYDLLCPAWAGRALAAAIPGAKALTFGRSAHFPWVEEPDAFFGAVRSFLAPALATRQ